MMPTRYLHRGSIKEASKRDSLRLSKGRAVSDEMIFAMDEDLRSLTIQDDKGSNGKDGCKIAKNKRINASSGIPVRRPGQTSCNGPDNTRMSDKEVLDRLAAEKEKDQAYCWGWTPSKF
jgi:hypothetical protein